MSQTVTANQLVLMSPTAKKRSVDQPVRTESTESVSDWANRTGATGFLTNPEYRGMRKHRDLGILLDHVTS